MMIFYGWATELANGVYGFAKVKEALVGLAASHGEKVLPFPVYRISPEDLTAEFEEAKQPATDVAQSGELKDG